MNRKADTSLCSFLYDEDETSQAWKRGKTREWIKRRPEKVYFYNIVREQGTGDNDFIWFPWKLVLKNLLELALLDQSQEMTFLGF
jgi:hypothetical protein